MMRPDPRNPSGPAVMPRLQYRSYEGFRRVAVQADLPGISSGGHTMTSTSAAAHPAPPDYDITLVLAIELSNTSWVLAAQVPGLPRVKAKRSVKPTAEGLMAAIEAYREREIGRASCRERV